MQCDGAESRVKELESKVAALDAQKTAAEEGRLEIEKQLLKAQSQIREQQVSPACYYSSSLLLSAVSRIVGEP